MKKYSLMFVCLIASLLFTCQTMDDDVFVSQFNNLVWSDEFDGPSIDATKWTHQTGNGANYYPFQVGWGNQELQTYEEDNAKIENGELVIAAKFENNRYTSSKLVTKDLYEVKYGRIEARIKLPYGDAGLWPTFWLMGANVGRNSAAGEVHWPKCGEVDIMEVGGTQPDMVHFTTHFGNRYPNEYTYISRDYPIPDRGYHVYTIEWREDVMMGLINNELYYSLPLSRNPFFHHEFFMILNIAVGGTYMYSGTPASGNYTGEGLKMHVDWVRVYQ